MASNNDFKRRGGKSGFQGVSFLSSLPTIFSFVLCNVMSALRSPDCLVGAATLVLGVDRVQLAILAIRKCVFVR